MLKRNKLFYGTFSKKKSYFSTKIWGKVCLSDESYASKSSFVMALLSFNVKAEKEILTWCMQKVHEICCRCSTFWVLMLKAEKKETLFDACKRFMKYVVGVIFMAFDLKVFFL